MSRYEKAIARLLKFPKDYSYKELKALLGMVGYEEYQAGKTSGSRITFINKDKHIIKLHKPHGGSNLKEYQLKTVIAYLQKNGVIK